MTARGSVLKKCSQVQPSEGRGKGRGDYANSLQNKKKNAHWKSCLKLKCQVYYEHISSLGKKKEEFPVIANHKINKTAPPHSPKNFHKKERVWPLVLHTNSTAQWHRLWSRRSHKKMIGVTFKNRYALAKAEPRYKPPF